MRTVLITSYENDISWYKPYVGQTFVVEDYDEYYGYQVIKKYIPKWIRKELIKNGKKKYGLSYFKVGYTIRKVDCEDAFIEFMKKAIDKHEKIHMQ